MINRIRNIFRLFTRETRVWWFVFGHSKTPRPVKILLLLAVAYTVLPFDFSLDFIPFFGFLDDAAILSIALFVAGKLTPADILSEGRKRAGVNESPD